MSEPSPIAQAGWLQDAMEAAVNDAGGVRLPELPIFINQAQDQINEAREKLENTPAAQSSKQEGNRDDGRQEPERIYYEEVRRAGQCFWDALAEHEWPSTGENLPTLKESVEQFEDALIRFGFPLELDKYRNWREAAQEFVPGLDRLIRCTRTVDRRKGLRVLQRTLRDTEVGLYDGEATASDLGLMNSRREVAGHALAWLLNQPCQPCRPTDALRREVGLAMIMMESNPIGDPEESYVDYYEQGELLSTVRPPSQAPPYTNPEDPLARMPGVDVQVWDHPISRFFSPPPYPGRDSR